MSVSDSNVGGTIHGGAVMKLCDEAAALAAVRHCHARVVTAGMDRMTFLEPVELGDLLTLKASVNAVWRTSMEVGVRVEAERPRTGVVRHTSSAYLTMVAVDENGRPTPIPSLLTGHPEEARREREAQTRRHNRLAERSHLQEAAEIDRAHAEMLEPGSPGG
jgi:acyl-CoA hydrolase